MLKNCIEIALAVCALAPALVAQASPQGLPQRTQRAPAGGTESGQPKVRVNYLNVCSPGEEESRLMATMLERIPSQPRFAEDFEISRGRSSLSGADLKLRGAEEPAAEASSSNWIRIRREFPEGQPFVSTQYSFSISGSQVAETLSWRARDINDAAGLMQLSISTSSGGVADPAQVARLNTPAGRIRVERFGRSSIVLARCAGADQARYEALFQRAGELLANYRGALRVATVVPAEIARLPKPAPARAPRAGNPAP